MLRSYAITVLALLYLIPTIFALPSQSTNHTLDTQIESNLEKRCTGTCPWGHYRVSGCGCAVIPGYYFGCKLLCVAKPEVKASPILKAFGGVPHPAETCNDQTSQTLRARQSYNPSIKAYDDKSFTLQQFWDSNDEASSQIQYTGNINPKGDMWLFSTKPVSKGRKYIVGFTIIGWTYYYTLEGGAYCHTSNEDLTGSLSQIDVLEVTH